jgi:hypothetical protein
MNVIFLDFDGVVNIPMWNRDENGKMKCRYNLPDDGSVNDFQAVQWVSEFCEKYKYSIVISSTWRSDGLEMCEGYLRARGLRKYVNVIGCTPDLWDKRRGDEITSWLNEHPNVTGYLIFDDECDMTIHMDRLVKCDTVVGFTLREFNQAKTLHDAFNKR